MKTKLFTIFTVIIAALAVTISISAQSKKQSRNARLFELVQAAKLGNARLNPETARRVAADFALESNEEDAVVPSIVGSWNCHITTSDAGNPPFDALQTFSTDGTFVETSSLLGMGGEGPAHGVYQRFKRGYLLTFVLFVFDPETGESVGQVRVRASIRMTGPNDFNAITAVDFIEPDGTVIWNIDGGPFSGTKLQVRGL